MTSIAGTIDGLSVTGLLTPHAFKKNDNAIFLAGAPLGSPLDRGGVSFLLSDGDKANFRSMRNGDIK